MSTIEAFTIEQRGGYDLLVGKWPNLCEVATELFEVLRLPDNPCVGDYFMINVANANAMYRIEELLGDSARCRLIRGERWSHVGPSRE